MLLFLDTEYNDYNNVDSFSQNMTNLMLYHWRLSIRCKSKTLIGLHMSMYARLGIVEKTERKKNTQGRNFTGKITYFSHSFS